MLQKQNSQAAWRPRPTSPTTLPCQPLPAHTSTWRRAWLALLLLSVQEVSVADEESLSQMAPPFCGKKTRHLTMQAPSCAQSVCSTCRRAWLALLLLSVQEVSVAEELSLRYMAPPSCEPHDLHQQSLSAHNLPPAHALSPLQLCWCRVCRRSVLQKQNVQATWRPRPANPLTCQPFLCTICLQRMHSYHVSSVSTQYARGQFCR